MEGIFCPLLIFRFVLVLKHAEYTYAVVKLLEHTCNVSLQT